MRTSGIRHLLQFGIAALGALLVLLSIAPLMGFAQEEPEDPVARGAWLYEGNCARCHGVYGNERVGRDAFDEDDLYAQIENTGCQLSWGKSFGGPFSKSDINDVVAYIFAWEEAGGSPAIGTLPPQPTITPTPTITPEFVPDGATPTLTPTPQVDQVLQVILSGSDLALGAWVHTQYCYTCHLNYARGRQARDLPGDRVYNSVKSGRAGTSMNPFYEREGGELSIGEVRAVVDYMLAWEELGEDPALPDVLFIPPTPDPQDFLVVYPIEVPPVEGDLMAGEARFLQYCSGCHGTLLEGGFGKDLTKTWTSIRPDLTLKSTLTNGIPASYMPAWGKNRSGPFSEEEVNDLVVFLLSRADEVAR